MRKKLKALENLAVLLVFMTYLPKLSVITDNPRPNACKLNFIF